MMRPQKWDLKTWLMILAFFGLGSAAAVIRFARIAAGWLAAPAIQETAARERTHFDSLFNAGVDTLGARAARRDSVILHQVVVLKAVVSDLPGAKEAATRRRLHHQTEEELFGAIPRLKGDSIP